MVSGRLPPEVIQRIVRNNFGRMRACYENGLRRDPNLAGRVSVRFVIGPDGSVTSASDGGSAIGDAAVVACTVRAFQSLSFPQPEGGIVTVVYPIIFSPEGSTSSPPNPGFAPPPANAFENPNKPPPAPEPYTGKFATFMETLHASGAREAFKFASDWHAEDPGDVLGLVALGEALEGAGDLSDAARAYGSIVDLFSNRADLRRFAGTRLERIHGDAGLPMALDTFTKAREERPDHPASHRLLAFARLKNHEYEKAFEAAKTGLKQPYPSGRFAGVTRILSEDLGLIAAAWMHDEPARQNEIMNRLTAAGGTVENAPSLRFVLNWETDANDVDFHIYDGEGNHAYYNHRSLPTGGELYADVTTGYGPECFTIRGAPDTRVGPYKLQANYYSRGPMGYGMGKLEIIEHDGKGGLTIEERPYIVMVDHAFVELGSVGEAKVGTGR
jgi:hypothetical protein